jgi:hypothetical protein
VFDGNRFRSGNVGELQNLADVSNQDRLVILRSRYILMCLTATDSAAATSARFKTSPTFKTKIVWLFNEAVTC